MKTNLTLYHIFYTVAKLGNISRAANDKWLDRLFCQVIA